MRYLLHTLLLAVPDPEQVERSYAGDGAIIGKELILDIKFHSRPPPHFEDFEWYPYDLEEPITNTTTIGRYTAENITEVMSILTFVHETFQQNLEFERIF